MKDLAIELQEDLEQDEEIELRFMFAARKQRELLDELPYNWYVIRTGRFTLAVGRLTCMRCINHAFASKTEPRTAQVYECGALA